MAPLAAAATAWPEAQARLPMPNASPWFSSSRCAPELSSAIAGANSVPNAGMPTISRAMSRGAGSATGASKLSTTAAASDSRTGTSSPRRSDSRPARGDSPDSIAADARKVAEGGGGRWWSWFGLAGGWWHQEGNQEEDGPGDRGGGERGPGAYLDRARPDHRAEQRPAHRRAQRDADQLPAPLLRARRGQPGQARGPGARTAQALDETRRRHGAPRLRPAEDQRRYAHQRKPEHRHLPGSQPGDQQPARQRPDQGPERIRGDQDAGSCF